METNVPGVYAVGECAEHRGIAYGLVAPLYEQGAVLAKHLAGVETSGYAGSVTSTKLKVSGVDVFSAGHFADPEGTRSMRYQDEVEGVYKKSSSAKTGSSGLLCSAIRGWTEAVFAHEKRGIHQGQRERASVRLRA